ncbi:hypothetical protein [Kochikohdavirus PBEF19]|uniref:Uncharacterized protein n=1 Tax=Enterococcus phage PBEF129 TaxID=2696337 RepID=A0A7T3MLA8_9CAUD|nr:hypothetical protein [Enterococcus phage PBEF129]
MVETPPNKPRTICCYNVFFKWVFICISSKIEGRLECGLCFRVGSPPFSCFCSNVIPIKYWELFNFYFWFLFNNCFSFYLFDNFWLFWFYRSATHHTKSEWGSHGSSTNCLFLSRT